MFEKIPSHRSFYHVAGSKNRESGIKTPSSLSASGFPCMPAFLSLYSLCLYNEKTLDSGSKALPE